MGEVAMVETVKRILAIFLIGMLSACAALNRGAGDIRTIDHAVAHVSTVPAIKSEAVQLFLREKILASASATPRPVVLMVHGGVSLHEASRQWLMNATFNGARRGEFRMKPGE
jgi:hypothetical protein